MAHREPRRGGRRGRVKTSRGLAVVIASLIVLAWAINAWPPAEPGALAVDDARPLHAAVPRASFTFAVTSRAALQRGDLGFAPWLVPALCREPLPLRHGGGLGGGRTAEEFRALYEGDPGEAARFMFARRAPRPDWSAH